MLNCHKNYFLVKASRSSTFRKLQAACLWFKEVSRFLKENQNENFIARSAWGQHVESNLYGVLCQSSYGNYYAFYNGPRDTAKCERTF